MPLRERRGEELVGSLGGCRFAAVEAEHCRGGTEPALMQAVCRRRCPKRAVLASLLAFGCSSPEAPSGVATSVEIGVPAGADGLGFAPILNGQELRLQTFGQGGTHVLIAVRCSGFGSRAFISASLTNLMTGTEVSEPPPARPQLLYCAGNGVCDLVPFLLHASGLTTSESERNGLHVQLKAKAQTDAGLYAEAVSEIVLSTADL